MAISLKVTDGIGLVRVGCHYPHAGDSKAAEDRGSEGTSGAICKNGRNMRVAMGDFKARISSDKVESGLVGADVFQDEELELSERMMEKFA